MVNVITVGALCSSFWFMLGAMLGGYRTHSHRKFGPIFIQLPWVLKDSSGFVQTLILLLVLAKLGLLSQYVSLNII